VALTTLGYERAAIGSSSGGGSTKGIGDTSLLIQLVCSLSLEEDPLVCSELVSIYSGFQVARWSSQRAAGKLRSSEDSGAELSGAKLALANNLTDVSNFVARVLGPKTQADTRELGTHTWSQLLLGTRCSRIAGCTDEIHRNAMVERGLDLPRDPSTTEAPSR
jgi:alkylation response protein AidB-like acyl-CoA dehydrogenase